MYRIALEGQATPLIRSAPRELHMSDRHHVTIPTAQMIFTCRRHVIIVFVSFYGTGAQDLHDLHIHVSARGDR